MWSARETRAIRGMSKMEDASKPCETRSAASSIIRGATVARPLSWLYRAVASSGALSVAT